MEEKSSMNYGFLIILFLLFIFIGGGTGLNRVAETAVVGNNAVGTRDILDTTIAGFQGTYTQANTNTNAIIDQTRQVGAKVDFYAYEGLKDQLAQERSKNIVLENRVYSDGMFNALSRQIADCCCATENRFTALEYSLPKQPPYYARGFYPAGVCVPQCTTTTA